MVYDGLNLIPGTTIGNAAIDSGTSFPNSPSAGQLFYRTDSANEGMYIYTSIDWDRVGSTVDFDGLNVKAAVRASTTANITLSGTQTVDGAALVVGNRVLVKNQSAASQNGIYLVASGAWTRSSDFDGNPSDEVKAGDFVFVTSGTSQADTGWVLTTDGTITIGTTALQFAQFTGGSSAANTLTGTTLASNVVSSSLTSVGTLSTLAVNGLVNLTGTGRLQLNGTDGAIGQLYVSAGSSAAGWSTGLTYTYATNRDLQIGDGTGAGQHLFRIRTAATEMQIGQVAEAVAGFSANALSFVRQGSAGTVPLGIGTSVNQPLVLFSNNVERFRILANGSWSIGSNGTSTGTAGQVLTSSGSGSAPAWSAMPAQTKLERVTTFNADALGKRVALSAGVTIPASTYAAGDAVSFYNTTSSAITIAQGGGLTLRQDGTSNTGNRILAGYGTCFVWFNSPTEAVISGSLT